jgi:hypothetical protein
MTDQALILTSFASICVGFVLALYLGVWLGNISWWKKAIIKSLALALFLGFGIVGGGGEVGFARIMPVVPAFFAEQVEWRLYSAVYPFLMWWVLFLGLLIIRHFWRLRTNA